MWSVLDSPRRRRRLLIPAVAVVLAIPLIYLGVHFSSPGSKGEATGPAVADTGYAEAKQVPFTAAKKRQVRKALAQFIGTAVARQDIGIAGAACAFFANAYAYYYDDAGGLFACAV